MGGWRICAMWCLTCAMWGVVCYKWCVRCDVLQVMCEMWCVTNDVWGVRCDVWGVLQYVCCSQRTAWEREVCGEAGLQRGGSMPLWPHLPGLWCQLLLWWGMSVCLSVCLSACMHASLSIASVGLQVSSTSSLLSSTRSSQNLTKLYHMVKIPAHCAVQYHPCRETVRRHQPNGQVLCMDYMQQHPTIQENKTNNKNPVALCQPSFTHSLFNSVQFSWLNSKNCNHPTRGNFVAVMAGS